jgi:plastocyanin
MSPRRGLAPPTPLLALLLLTPVVLLALAACATATNEVDMGVASFRQSSVTIKVGEAVHFVDPASGGTHVVCVGKDLACIPQPGAPAALDTTAGLQFNTGDTRDVVFPNAGTYTVVCIIHPGMVVTIVVQS